MRLSNSACVAQVSAALSTLANLLGEEPSLPGHTAAGLGVIIRMLGERLEPVAGDLMDAEFRP